MSPVEPLAGLEVDDERYRLLIEAITDYAIYMLDAEGRVSSWNPGAQRFKGYTAAEILGQHFSRFYTPEDRAAGLPARALRIAATEGRFEREGWRMRKDGSRFWAHVVIDPVRDADGELVGFAKITRDLTERKEAEDALKEAREMLFQAQKLDAIGHLTGGVAHDFNNLLMVILGSLELVQKRLREPKLAPLVDNAIQAAQRGAGLTQRMLAFARKQELKVGAVDITRLVAGVTGLLGRSLGPSIQIETRLPRDLPLARSDANQLETALLNLVVNARDAMPDGGVIRIMAAAQTLAAESAVGLAPGPYVRLSVRDSGMGMDAETLARAAEPFFTTKGVGKGTGLGLSMVHGLAEQSGGRLVIKSRVGAGSTLELWLPQAAADEADAAAAAAPETSETLAPRVILAVDDDTLVLMNTVAMLEDLGHRVFAATTFDEAMEIFWREPIDLVITDYAMPQVSGVRLAKAIRAERPDLPVILATGYAELQPGAEGDFPRLAKPFLQADLDRMLKQVASAPAPAL